MVRHFKILAAFAARFLSVSDHFGTLWMKGLTLKNQKKMQ